MAPARSEHDQAPGSVSSAHYWVWLTGPLAFVTPFVARLYFDGYGFARGEVVACIAALVAVGAVFSLLLVKGGRGLRAFVAALLLALFLDYLGFIPKTSWWIVFPIMALSTALGWALRERYITILNAVFASFLVSTVLMGQPAWLAGNAELPPARDTSLPIVLHVVLDAQIGIEGIPGDVPGGPALRDDLEDLFHERGFRYYGRAFSPFYNTRHSLSHLVNLRQEFTPGLYLRGGEGHQYTIPENRYFEHMHELGYRVRVHQASYLDFCGEGGRLVDECRSYPAWSMSFVAQQELPVFEKWALVSRLYPLRSHLYRNLRRGYNDLRHVADPEERVLPSWSWERLRGPSAESFAALESLARQAKSAQRGDLLFSHLLIPHSPYAYDRDCRLADVDQWRFNKNPLNPSSRANTAEQRRERYARYFEQVRCTMSLVDRVFDALEENPDGADAIVIIHGDHGSRIGLHEPRSKHRERLSDPDFVDAFSTLFAVRAPQVAPGADRRLVSTPMLLRSFLESGFQQPPGSGLEDVEPLIHYIASRGKITGTRRMVDFGRSQPALVAASGGTGLPR